MLGWKDTCLQLLGASLGTMWGQLCALEANAAQNRHVSFEQVDSAVLEAGPVGGGVRVLMARRDLRFLPFKSGK